MKHVIPNDADSTAIDQLRGYYCRWRHTLKQKEFWANALLQGIRMAGTSHGLVAINGQSHKQCLCASEKETDPVCRATTYSSVIRLAVDLRKAPMHLFWWWGV